MTFKDFTKRGWHFEDEFSKFSLCPILVFTVPFTIPLCVKVIVRQPE